MFEDLFRRPHVRQRIRQKPHGEVLERFVDYLSGRGYSRYSVQQYLGAAEHFGHWLGRRKITRRTAREFIDKHLRVCRCKTPAPRTSKSVVAALNRLLDMVGDNAIQQTHDSQVDLLLQRYANHLEHVQGLASATVHYRLRYARTLLAHFKVRRLADVKRWNVDRIRRFVATEGQRCKPASG